MDARLTVKSNKDRVIVARTWISNARDSLSTTRLALLVIATREMPRKMHIIILGDQDAITFQLADGTEGLGEDPS